MIGGITDFYRSWRGVKISTELILILKNWSLSFLLTLGIVSLTPSFDIPFHVLIIWFVFVTVGFVFLPLWNSIMCRISKKIRL